MTDDLNATPGAENPAPPNQDLQTPESKGEGNKRKVLLGAVVALALTVGLYFVNRFWIVPTTLRPASARWSGEHPLAPTFSLTDLNGQKLNLADYKGKVVMLDFWATWCGPCRIEIPGFIELQNRYRDQGFTVIGISVDDGPDIVREFYRQFKMNYPVALADDKIGDLYGGVFQMPTAFLIGRDGRIYAKHVGAMDVSVFEEEIKDLLVSRGEEEVVGFKPAGRADEVELGSPSEINSVIPGVDVSTLSAAELTRFEKLLQGEPCTCGCKLNLLKCRREDKACGISRKLAREQLVKFTGIVAPSPRASAVASPEGAAKGKNEKESQ